MPADAVEALGLREILTSLRTLEAELPRQMRGELSDMTRIVAGEARTIAAEEHLDKQRPQDKTRETSSLIRGIRTRVRGATGYVLSTAARTTGANAPFNYTRIYEYARNRPFLRPALERKRREVEGRLDDMLDRLARGI